MRLALVLFHLPVFAALAADPATPTLAESRAWLVTKKVIEAPADLEKVEELNFSEKQIKDDDLRYLIPLCGMKNLKKIDLRGNDVRGPGLGRLAKECGTFDSITTIDLFGNNELGDDALKRLAVFPNLEEMNLDDLPKVTGTGFIDLQSRLPKLKSLWLVGCPLNAEGLRAIARLETIEALNLARTPMNDEALELLGRKVTSLVLAGTKITDKGLTFLAEHLSLESIDVSRTAVTWEGLRSALPKLRKLKGLALGNLRLGGRIPDLVELLAPLAIESLSLKFNGLKSWKGVLPVAKLTSLKTLYVFDTDFETGNDKNALDPKEMAQFHDYRRSLKLPPVALRAQ